MRGHHAVLALLLVACGEGERSDVEVTRAAVNGTVDSADQYPMAVGVRVDKGGQTATCSGVLLERNLVLTARHCVSPTTGGLVECGSSPLGTPYPPANARVTRLSQMSDLPEDYLQVARIEVVPGGNDTCGFDLAALILDADGFGADAVVAVPRIDATVVDGEEHTAVGYGSTGSGGIGTRRFKTGLIAYCVGTDCPLPVPATEWVGAKDSFCQADSGAAALDLGGKLIGVVSRGQDPCATPILANLSEWKSWLMELGTSAATDGAYEPPFWAATGVSDPPAELDAGSSASCVLDTDCSAGMTCGSAGECVNSPTKNDGAGEEESGCTIAAPLQSKSHSWQCILAVVAALSVCSWLRPRRR